MQRKIISNPYLQPRYTFSSYEEVRRDVDLVHSLGWITGSEKDILLYFLRGIPKDIYDGTITRTCLFEKFHVKLNLLHGYNMMPKSQKEDLLTILKKMYHGSFM